MEIKLPIIYLVDGVFLPMQDEIFGKEHFGKFLEIMQ